MKHVLNPDDRDDERQEEPRHASELPAHDHTHAAGACLSKGGERVVRWVTGAGEATSETHSRRGQFCHVGEGQTEAAVDLSDGGEGAEGPEEEERVEEDDRDGHGEDGDARMPHVGC